MSSPPSFRRSVWIDVFGVVLLGALLLGGAGYVLVHTGKATDAFTQRMAPRPTESRRATGPGPRGGPPAPSPDPSFTLRRAEPPSSPSPRRRSPFEAPFAASWRAEAVPSLSGRSAGPGAAGAAPGGVVVPSTTPELRGRNRQWTGTDGTSFTAGRSRSSSSWRTEAEQLAGRALALSRQLGAMDRETSSPSTGGSSAERSSFGPGPDATAEASAAAPGAPTDPSQVPIDDHVHWLLAAGLLWGVGRLWRG